MSAQVLERVLAQVLDNPDKGQGPWKEAGLPYNMDQAEEHRKEEQLELEKYIPTFDAMAPLIATFNPYQTSDKISF